MKKFILIITALFFIISLPLFAFGAERIIKLDVIGNDKIDRGYIMNHIKTRENDPYDLEKLREDLKNIYKTGFFSDVQIDVRDTDKGKAVTFVVIERQTIEAIYISGNEKIKTNDIKEKLKIKSNTVLNTEKIKESIDEIKKLYVSKGYYSVKVTYEINYEKEYDVSVKFIIEEPPQAFVRKIIIKGNKHVKTSEIRSMMSTSEKGFFWWFTGSGLLDEEALEEDRKNIEALYHDKGYVRVKVGTPDINISKDGKTITISLAIDEGNLYKIDKIDFKGDVIFNKDYLFSMLKSRKDNIFRSTLYQQDVLTLTDLYQDKGYAFCEITPLTSIDDDNQKVNIDFEIKKNYEIFINRINIIGNTKTLDKVIRRELTFAEGDRFSSTHLKKSRKNLRNTTYFKETDMKIVKTDDPEKVNIDLTVEERQTGTLSLGVGYSSYEKVMVTGNISQENFFGTGRKVYLSAGLGSVTQEFRLTYVEPRIFDLDLDTSYSLFNYKRIMDSFDYKKLGGGFGLIRRLTEDVKGNFNYRYEKTQVTNIEDNASVYVKQQSGTRITSAPSVSLSTNTIDDIMNPYKGVAADASLEVAGGPFGGDNYFIKSVVSYGQYIPANFWDSTFFVKGTAGAIRPFGGRQIPIYEKFYVGGLYSVRGFKYGEAGPVDSQGEIIGGKNQLFFNLEWIFPIYKPAGVKGVLFYDAGAGFDDSNGFMLKDMRAGAGFGIRWFSPLGPIRLELGFNLFPKKGESRNVFDFAIGTQY
ncbi:MAG TPA: outer membrane protein assembly factor BamA [Syntrophorhabdaceae bacterium]|nr:outer membrane protein assembly factor BamA [Syntrophorhabdaceae bacterium]